MRIWFIEIGEPLPMEKGVRLLRYGEFTRFLADRGHDVVWWTSNFSHAAKDFVFPGDARVDHNGVHFNVIGGPGYRRNVSLARLRHQRHFARRLAEELPRAPAPDLIVCPVPTIESASTVVAFAKAHGIPVLLDIRDEWPDEYIRNIPSRLQGPARLLLRPVYAKMRRLCAAADGIMGVSERQMAYGLGFAGRPRGPRDKVFYLGYQAKLVDEAQREAARRWWREQGVREGAFVVSWVGTMGAVRLLWTVLEATRMLAPRYDIQVVLAGDGQLRPRYQEYAADLPQVLFPGWLSAAQIGGLMDVSNVALAPYTADSAFSFPTKFFEYMAGRLPIVTSCGGEIRDVLAQHGCGQTYTEGNPQELAAVLEKLCCRPELGKEMGENGRKLFEEKFSFDRLFPDAEEHLMRVAAHLNQSTVDGGPARV